MCSSTWHTEPSPVRPTVFIDSDGYAIHADVHGSGPAMVLVHGWGSDSAHNWRDTGWIDALTPWRRLISIDVRGHGKSSKPHVSAPYGYAALSRDVLAVMDALDVERCDYMGYSMGAFMGAHLLGQHPARFTAMVLGGIGDETPESAAQGAAIAAALRAPNRDTVEDPVGRAVRRFAESNPQNDLQALACSAEAMWPQGYPLQLAGDGIAQADLPVLIVNGTNDHPYVDSADAFAAALPNARHARVEGCDHLTTVTDPETKRIVLEFLGIASA